MERENRFVLVLVHLFWDGFDIAGNKFPKEGFVKTKKFTRDKDIRYGIFGFEWGRTSSFRYDKMDKGYWAVVKTEKNDNYVSINSWENSVKFESGLVLHNGSIRTAAKFIVDTKTDYTHHFLEESLYIKPGEIAGTKEWFKIKINWGKNE